MAQTKHQIQSLLQEAGASPRQKFGQNFMIDGNLVRLVAQAGQIQSGDLLLEVGPGTGTLTEELLASGADVLAVEIDAALAESLRIRFGATKTFELIEGDALAGKHALNAPLNKAIATAKSQHRTVRLVANLPFNMASPLIIELLIAGVDFLAFTVQKEVADRLRAAPGSGQYGTLSIVTQLLSRVEILRTLPPQAFWPMPKIESSLVRLTRDDRLGTRAPEFGRFVQKIFSARRKTMKKSLSLAGVDDESVLAEVGINARLRPEEIAPEQFLRLFDQIAERRGGIKSAGISSSP
jgi:16S rRNA (adenine1518-N6/adenine1519-N6)-dimethyltransferase